LLLLLLLRLARPLPTNNFSPTDFVDGNICAPCLPQAHHYRSHMQATRLAWSATDGECSSGQCRSSTGRWRCGQTIDGGGSGIRKPTSSTAAGPADTVTSSKVPLHYGRIATSVGTAQ